MAEQAKGHCKHGEFILYEGCPQCIDERYGEQSTGNAPSGSTTALPITITDELLRGDSVQTFEGKPITALVKIKPEVNAEIISFYNEALKLQEYAERRVILSADDLRPATDDLSIIARLKKALEEKRKEYVSPLQSHVKTINDAFKTLMQPIEAADKITRDKILGFQAEQERKRQEQEEINRLRAEAAEKEAALNGKPVEPVTLVEVLPEAPKRVSTDMGTIGQRDNWKYEVTDFALVPDSYKMINAGILTPIVKASKGKITISGIRIFNEPIIAVNARG